MRSVRLGLLAGLALGVPVTLWLLAQAQVQGGSQGAVMAAAREALHALVLLQGLGAALIAPWLTRAERWLEGAAGIAMLVLVGLPLGAVAWATGAAAWTVVLRGQGGLLAGGVALYGLARAVIAAVPRGTARAQATALLQGLACAGLWASREQWLGWAGV